MRTECVKPVEVEVSTSKQDSSPTLFCGLASLNSQKTHSHRTVQKVTIRISHYKKPKACLLQQHIHSNKKPKELKIIQTSEAK